MVVLCMAYYYVLFVQKELGPAKLFPADEDQKDELDELQQILHLTQQSQAKLSPKTGLKMNLKLQKQLQL